MKLFRKKVDERISVNEFVAFLDLWDILILLLMLLFKWRKCNIRLLYLRRATRRDSFSCGECSPSHKPMPCDSASISSSSWKEDSFQIGPPSNISTTYSSWLLKKEWCLSPHLPWQATTLSCRRPSTSRSLSFCWTSLESTGTITTKTIRIRSTIICSGRRPTSKKTPSFILEWCPWRKSIVKWQWKVLFKHS